MRTQSLTEVWRGILGTDINWDAPSLQTLTPSAKDFLKTLLRRKPEERPSASQVGCGVGCGVGFGVGFGMGLGLGLGLGFGFGVGYGVGFGVGFGAEGCKRAGGFRCADVQEGFGVQMCRRVLVCRCTGGFWCAEVQEGICCAEVQEGAGSRMGAGGDERGC